jgi:hypothetical protein
MFKIHTVLVTRSKVLAVMVASDKLIVGSAGTRRRVSIKLTNKGEVTKAQRVSRGIALPFL